MKPISQFGSLIFCDSTNSLGVGINLALAATSRSRLGVQPRGIAPGLAGKDDFKFSDKPKLSEAFIPTSVSNPSLVKCFFLLIQLLV